MNRRRKSASLWGTTFSLGVVCLAALSQVACSPALNWRKVSVGGMSAMLPCKPDTAERAVPLGGVSVQMQMAGCEAEGVLFAASHVEAATPAAAVAMQQEWQRQALAALGASSSTVQALQVPTWARQATSVRATGRAPDGKPLEAQLRWMVRDAHIYHLAVYGPALPDTMTEPMTLEP